MVVVTNLTRQILLADRAEVARGPMRRMVGLLSRERLEPGEALVIPRCSAVHTCFMRFAIDVVFLKGSVVLRAVERLAPFRFAWAAGADTVIELPAGTITRTATQKGAALGWNGAC